MLQLRDQENMIVDESDVISGHAVIEASAGTGKTYTIEHLVLRILMDRPDVSLSQILLVTYTEKAAGELKERIRDRIAIHVDKEPDEQAAGRLRRALDDFDQASISTIHSFCNRVLTEFAFENSRPLQLEQGDDDSTLRRVLAGVIRDEWVRLPHDQLEPVKTSSSLKPGIVAALEMRSEILKTAGQIRFNDGLLPLVEPGPAGLMKCRTADELAAWTVHETVARAARQRRSSSKVTFDDMIVDVRAALYDDGPVGRMLLARLRSRFVYGIVDEFQDTDPDQWDIFQRIFIEGASNRLIVVGDPKQAIYSFRGADVRTYLRARSEIGKHSGRLLRLGVNYRSSPAMIDAFNRIFSASCWFDNDSDGRPEKDEDRIVYSASESPGPDRSRKLISDMSRRGAVVPVMISDPEDETDVSGVGLARYRYVTFIADEIKALMSDHRIVLPRGDNGEKSPLVWDDICVLIQKHSEYALLSKLFRERGIPFTAYKPRTLYSSAEAESTLVLLKALAISDPGEQRRVLQRVALTPFFFYRGGVSDIKSEANMERVAEVMDSWRTLAASRNWARLFNVLSSDTGLFLREAAEADGERRLANWRQIFSELVCFADNGSMDIRGLAGRLSLLCSGKSENDDSVINRLESELPRVRIITFHAAKGLEFPFVFVASGFSSGGRRNKVFRGYADGRRYFQFSAAGRPDSSLSQDDDSTRLFYVAMTRAMYRLYFPAFWRQKKGNPVPLTTFLNSGARSLFDGGDSGALATRVFLDGRHHDDLVSSPEPPDLRQADKPADDDDRRDLSFNLAPVGRVAWSRRRFRLDSYSSLTRRAKRASFGVDENGGSGRQDDDVEQTPVPSIIGVRPGETAQSTDCSVPLLPAGATFGDAFHEVMQGISEGLVQPGGPRVDFSDVARMDSAASLLDSPVGVLIRRAMTRHGIVDKSRRSSDGGASDSAALEFARLVYSALTTPLNDEPGGFRLCDLSSADTVAEMEFHMDRTILSGHGVGENSERQVNPGLLNGFIDLVFRHRGRFWFLDWKTTTVRPSVGSVGDNDPASYYTGGSLLRAMEDNHYLFQAHVYRIALANWLTGIYGPDGPGMLGGGYYLFVRGMTAPGHGVWCSDDEFSRHSIPDSRLKVGRLLEGRDEAREYPRPFDNSTETGRDS